MSCCVKINCAKEEVRCKALSISPQKRVAAVRLNHMYNGYNRMYHISHEQ